MFTSCTNYRKQVLKRQPGKESDYPIYDHLSDLVDKTLCPKLDGIHFYATKCCDRECTNCGMAL